MNAPCCQCWNRGSGRNPGTAAAFAGFGRASPGVRPFPRAGEIILTPFDQAIESSKWPLVRYADYLLTFLKEPGAGAAVSRIETHLAELGLGLNAAKTRPASFEEGFHFLGAWFTGHLIYQPWKGGVVFHAPPMPARLQHAWRDRHPGRPKSRPPARSLCCADGRPIS